MGATTAVACEATILQLATGTCMHHCCRYLGCGMAQLYTPDPVHPAILVLSADTVGM